jgi:hypothetical protein
MHGGRRALAGEVTAATSKDDVVAALHSLERDD